MFKKLFYKLEEVSINIGARSKILYNYLLQTSVMIFVNHYVTKYVQQPINNWYTKKKQIYITNRNKLYMHIQHTNIKNYMEKLLYTFPAYMPFFFTYAQTSFMLTVSVWLCYWLYFWCAILYLRSVIFVFPLAIKNNYTLSQYLAIWVLVWLAPMLFYMFVYYPFWYYYQR